MRARSTRRSTHFSIPLITCEPLLFQKHELGNAGSDRAVGGGVRPNNVSDLSRHSNPRADKRTPAVGGQCSHRAVGRSDMRLARQRRVRRHFSSRCSIFRRSRSCLETQVQRLLQPFLQPLRSNVFLLFGRHTYGILMGQDRADAERFHCLSRNTTMVGGAETLAYGRVWPRRGRDYREGQQAQSVRNLQSTRDCRPENTRMNDLAEITEFAKRYAKAWCGQNPESVAAFFA